MEETTVGRTDDTVSPRNSFMGEFISNIIKAFIISMCVRFFIMQFINFNNRQTNSTTINNKIYQEIYGIDDKYSMWMYIVESDNNERHVSTPQLIWHLPNLSYGDYYGGLYKNSTYFYNYSFNVSHNLLNNGSVTLITCFVKSENMEPDLSHKIYDMNEQICEMKRISRYMQFHVANKKHLLNSGTIEEISENDQIRENLIKKYNNTITTYWHPSIAINTIFSLPQLSLGAIPSPMDKFTYFDNSDTRIYPIIYYNDFWNYYADYYPISNYNRTLSLNITFYPLSFMKWQFFIAQSEQHQWSFLQQHTPSELDNLKRMLLETNFYVLILTLAVSILHSVFEFLAFKNDIQFWKNRDSYEGISLRSVVFGIFQHIIVLLYVLDNETNIMVTFGLAVGLLIEIWKLTKIFHINFKVISPNIPIPIPTFTYKSIAYSQSKTHEYDAIAFKYLSIVLAPLVCGYAIYSLIYHQHKGWYSFILGVLYGFLLLFGFIMMTPQLFINYKMKSVAHLPWRMLTYKALNTFIDDIFAFVITMPTLYRLGCLRDDIIFVIYIYQRWIYPTDMKRVNEFGISGEEVSEISTQKLEHQKTE